MNALHVVARMTVAYFMFGYSLVMYTICIEVVGPSARSKASFMYFIIYGLGTLIMSYPLASHSVTKRKKAGKNSTNFFLGF